MEPSAPPPCGARWRRRFAAVLAALAPVCVAGLVAVSAPAASAAVPAPPSGWSTVFSDDFTGASGSGPLASNWTYDTGPGSSFGTGEVETMTNSPGNVHLDGAGDLDITARDSGGAWTSGRIASRGSVGAPAGGELEVTASIEQPDPSSGVGYWPAFWMLGPGQWPENGEIDILEDVNALSEHSGTFHCGTDPGGPCNEGNGIGSGLRSCGGCQTGYHTYTAIVNRTNTSNESITWYLDGNQFYRVDEGQVDTGVWQAAVDHNFRIVLDLAMGGAYPNGVCDCAAPTGATASGGTMRVAYVAAYETGADRSAGHSRTIVASKYTASAGTVVEPAVAAAGGAAVGSINATSWLEYADVDFGSGTGTGSVAAHIASTSPRASVNGRMEFRLDSATAAPFATIPITGTGGFANWITTPAVTASPPPTGTHTLYVTFAGSGDDLVHVDRFGLAGTPTGTSQGASTGASTGASDGTTTGPITGVGGLCLDAPQAGTTPDEPVDLSTCDGTKTQQWTTGPDRDIEALGLCLDGAVGTAPGTAAVLDTCDGGSGQTWLSRANGELVDPVSGLCLDDPGSDPAPDTGLVLAECSGRPGQAWTLP